MELKIDKNNSISVSDNIVFMQFIWNGVFV